jgi:hypothetical protein
MRIAVEAAGVGKVGVDATREEAPRVKPVEEGAPAQREEAAREGVAREKMPQPVLGVFSCGPGKAMVYSPLHLADICS